MLKRKIYSSIFIVSTLFYFSCSAILLPKKQKLTVKTDNDQSSVYVNNVEVAKGKSSLIKIEKKGVQQVVTQTPGYKDEYTVLVPYKKDPLHFPLRVLSLACFVMPWYIESSMPSEKTFMYNKEQKLSSKSKLISKTENDKYIDLDAIKLDIKDKNVDIVEHFVLYSENPTELAKNMKEAEVDHKEMLQKNALKKAKKELKKGKVKTLNEDSEKEIKYDDTKFSVNVFKTLKNTGFIDTVNTVFKDNNNTLSLEGAIKKVVSFRIRGKASFYSSSYFMKTRLTIVWKIRNSYGELLDSIVREDYSGNFKSDYYNGTTQMQKMFADAVDISFNNLLNDDKFKKYMAIDVYKNPNLALIKLTEPKGLVKEVADATDASVIIKRKDKGHGSGFAVSQDGYILTNFHVISDKKFDTFSDIKVILTNGTEVDAKIVRVNRAKDLALLKVDAKFDKAFKIENKKLFKKLQEVYTVGTPKSIELGQTVSIGLISNERSFNNNNLLQLSMSVNPGNSGGPLFEKSGVLHGVIQSKLVGYATEGISFAIPAYSLLEYLNISY